MMVAFFEIEAGAPLCARAISAWELIKYWESGAMASFPAAPTRTNAPRASAQTRTKIILEPPESRHMHSKNKKGLPADREPFLGSNLQFDVHCEVGVKR